MKSCSFQRAKGGWGQAEWVVVSRGRFEDIFLADSKEVTALSPFYVDLQVSGMQAGKGGGRRRCG